MKFEELLKKYKDGTATAEEIAAVEEELEKVRLIEEYLAEADAPLPLPEVAVAGEVKAVQRTIKRRTRRTAAAVVAGVLALLLLLQYVLLPLANRRVYDESDFDREAQYLSKYEMFMDTVTQLYMPFYRYYGTSKTTTGFGQWTLLNSFWSLQGDHSLLAFTLTCGSLNTDPAGEAFRTMFPAIHGTSISTRYQHEGRNSRDEALARLDDSVEVSAAVFFSRELTLEEVLALQEQHSGIDVWSAMLDWNYGFPVQLSFTANGIGWGEGANEDYPLLFVYDTDSMTADMWQQHLESQLQFLQDHEKLTQTFRSFCASAPRPEDVKDDISFVGMWVTGTGSELLALYDTGVVGDIQAQDAHISLS